MRVYGCSNDSWGNLTSLLPWHRKVEGSIRATHMNAARCALGASGEPSKGNIKHVCPRRGRSRWRQQLWDGRADRCDPPGRSRAFWSMLGAVRGGCPIPIHGLNHGSRRWWVHLWKESLFPCSSSSFPPQRCCLRFERQALVSWKPGRELKLLSCYAGISFTALGSSFTSQRIPTEESKAGIF